MTFVGNSNFEGMLLKELKYQTYIYNECTSGKLDWICKSCHDSMSKNKMLMQAQLVKMEFCSKFTKLDRLCPIEVDTNFYLLLLQKRLVPSLDWKNNVLVPAELKKIQTILQRSCDEEYLISLGLERWLTDKSVVNKQEIRPALVNSALQKLPKINPFYSNFTVDNEWEDLSELMETSDWQECQRV